MIIKVNKTDRQIIKKDFIWIPEKGDRVEVIVERSQHQSIKTPKCSIGTIVEIDGQYITVKFDQSDKSAKYYLSEINLIQ